MFSSKSLNKLQNIFLYLFVFLLPWQTRYIFSYLKLGNSQYEYGKLSIYFSEIFLSFLFITFLINWIFFWIKDSKISKTFLFAFLLFVVSTFTYFFAKDLNIYFYGLLRLCEAIFLLFILSRTNFSWAKIAIAFVSSMTIEAVLGIYQFFSQHVFANKYFGIAEQIPSLGGVSVIENSFGRFLRAYAGFSHPNIFGGFLVIAILLLIIIYLNGFNKKNIFLKSIFWISLILMLSALVMTFSRSAFLSLIISIIFILFISIRKKFFTRLLPIFIVIFVIFFIDLFVFGDLFHTRVVANERLEQKSSIERQELLKESFNIIKGNWYSGIGLYNYVQYTYLKNPNLNIYEYQPVHNVFVLVFAELGILGILSYLLILAFSFFEKFKSKDKTNILLASLIICIFIINLFDHYFWTSFSGIMMFFIIIGIQNKGLNNIF